MSMLQVTCECGKQFRVSDEHAGKRARCQCGRTLQVPGQPSSDTVSPSGLEAETSTPGGLRPELTASLRAQDHIDQFVLVRKLGEGAMGQVWLARDSQLDREVAIKVLPSELRHDKERLQRFQREAKLMAKLDHPNVVRVLHLGDNGQLLYLVMEYVRGGSLADRVKASGPLPWREATRAIRDAAAGLAEAHRWELVHRDIKPANLLRTPQGVIKVADFGLARRQFQETELTQEGSFLGTPSYMAPEQWAGKPADGRSDLYSLICSYFFLLTGRAPFEADNWPALGYQHRHEPLPDLRRELSTLPEEVWQVLQCGSQKVPELRYPTASDLRRDLDRLLALPGPAPAPTTPSRSLEAPSIVAPNRPNGILTKIKAPLGRSIVLTAAFMLLLGTFCIVVWWSKINAPSVAENGGKNGTEVLDSKAATAQTAPNTPPSVGAIGGRNATEASDSNAPTTQAAHVTPPTIREESIGMEFKFIPSGTFVMGSNDEYEDERPAGERVITRPFYLSICEVTQQQYEAVTSSNPSRFKNPPNPVENVDWIEAVEFCRRLTAANLEGRVYRLPTEAEWEYAARAGSSGKWCFGDVESQLGEYAWYEKNSSNTTHPVGQKKPNAWGLYDMHGNVWEWCNDWYDERFYGKSPKQNPVGPLWGSYRVSRGGSWYNPAVHCRSSRRAAFAPGNRDGYLGFRVVLSPSGP